MKVGRPALVNDPPFFPFSHREEVEFKLSISGGHLPLTPLPPWHLFCPANAWLPRPRCVERSKAVLPGRYSVVW